MSSREFAEWQAYDRISPIGARRFDLLAALIASVAANAAGGREDGTPYDLADFVPRWGEHAVRDRASGGPLDAAQRERLLAWARSLVRATGGSVRET